MVRVRPDMPAGHGEVVTVPPVDQWSALLAANAASRDEWRFQVGGVDVASFVACARSEAAGEAEAFSARLGVPLTVPDDPTRAIAMTGHQPELYHPGVWIKDFLLERVTRETGALGIDMVVDTDAFDTLRIEAPCMRPDVQRCREYLAVGGPDICYARVPTLTPDEADEFSASCLDMLKTLPAPSVARHYAEFAVSLRSAAADAHNLAELTTFARRRYEASAGTGYLELPVTTMVRGSAFLRFCADILMRADEFADVFDGELASYRERANVRSQAQPFPDMRRTGDLQEVPFWIVDDRHRVAAYVRTDRDEVTLCRSDGTEVASLGAGVDTAVQALAALGGILVAPRAVTLTLYSRMFLADLFIHGIGGARYDAVTDAVALRWYGVEPPAYVVASMTLYLPIGVHMVTDEEVARAHDDVNRLKHNPDQMLERIDFDDPSERASAQSLMVEKRGLVVEIGAPDADKKTLSKRIREVNDELSAMLEPLRVDIEERLEHLVAEQAAAEVLTDRTYPFCFWSPSEVADKAW
jgi:hypothetical protein